MIFKKNVTRAERNVRIVGGLLMIACGLIGLHASPLGWGVAAAGAVSLLTGLVRYCPACDLAGRRPCADR